MRVLAHSQLCIDAPSCSRQTPCSASHHRLSQTAASLSSAGQRVSTRGTSVSFNLPRHSCPPAFRRAPASIRAGPSLPGKRAWPMAATSFIGRLLRKGDAAAESATVDPTAATAEKLQQQPPAPAESPSTVRPGPLLSGAGGGIFFFHQLGAPGREVTEAAPALQFLQLLHLGCSSWN